jgi:hypothetical protein
VWVLASSLLFIIHHKMRIVSQILEILLAMSGVVLRRMTVLRTLSILVSLAVYWYCSRVNSFALAAWYFAAATLIHYVLLVGMFRPNGWSVWCIKRFGEEKGFRYYEAWMSFAFFHNGVSTALMCAATQGTLWHYVPEAMTATVPAKVSEAVLMSLGIALSCIGLPVKVWATLVVGIDTYYYRDLFLRRPLCAFKAAGPYRYLKNPMYGVGHLHGYGTALVSASLPGLVIVAYNQACVWLFYRYIERPHVRNIFAQNLDSLSVSNEV